MGRPYTRPKLRRRLPKPSPEMKKALIIDDLRSRGYPVDLFDFVEGEFDPPGDYYVGVAPPEIADLDPTKQSYWFDLSYDSMGGYWVKRFDRNIEQWTTEPSVPRYALSAIGAVVGALTPKGFALSDAPATVQAVDPSRPRKPLSELLKGIHALAREL